MSCQDAAKNDLGLKVIDVSDPEAATSTIILDDASEVTILSKTASKGPITLQYTVTRSNADGWTAKDRDKWGIVGTIDGSGSNYKGANGSIRYHLKQNFLYPSYTYKYVISTNAETGMVEVEAYQNGTKVDKFYAAGYCPTEGEGNRDSKYFGIYLDATEHPKDAVLTNVICQDADGTDLGVKAIGSGATVMPDSELPGEFGEITYEHFSIDDQTVKAGTSVSGNWMRATSMDGVAFVGTVQFGEKDGQEPGRTEMFVIGGKTDWDGLQIYYQENGLMVVDATGATKQNYGILGTITEKKAGVPLKNAPIDLRVSFKYVNEEDVRIRIRINGVECMDKVVKGMVETIGCHLLISAAKNPITIQSSKSKFLLPYPQIDFAEFGFTEKWAYTLGLRK